MKEQIPIDRQDQSKQEISFKDLVLKIQSLILEVLKNWKWAPLSIVLVTSFLIVDRSLHKTAYPAKLTFMINEDESNSISAFSGILGQFGLNSPSSEYNLDKILELLRSRHITQKALLQQKAIYGKEDLLINHLINNLDTVGEWVKSKWYMRPFIDQDKVKEMKMFRFNSSEISFNNKLENKALKTVYKKLTGDPISGTPGILQADYSEFSGIMTLTAACYDPEISILVTNSFYQVLSDFYVEKTIEKQQKTFDIIKMKYDSISSELRSAEFGLANFRDSNKNIFSNKTMLEESRLRNKVTIMTAAIAKASENLEIADFALQNKTPFIQLIDQPIPPIRSDKKSIFSCIFKGIIFGGILYIFTIVGSRFWRELMQQNP